MELPLAIGLITLAAILVLAIGLRRFLVGGGAVNDRLRAYITLPEPANHRRPELSRTWVTHWRVRLNAAFSGFATNALTRQLMSANWPLTPTEFILTRLVITVFAFLLGWLIAQSILVGLGAALIVYLVPGIMLRLSVNRRREKFSRQLVDVLVLMTGAVRAGFSLLQAIEVVTRELGPPASEEFLRVVREVSLGRTLHQALNDLAERMEDRDLNLLVTAVNIQYQVGGNLAYMLSSVTETIRERIRLFGEVRVLTTQSRMTAYVLSLLPFFVFGILFMIAPSYMIRLFDRSIICIPLGALTGIILGFILVRRMARIDI